MKKYEDFERGLVPLTEQELSATNGGVAILPALAKIARFIASAMTAEYALDPAQAKASFMEGYNSVRNK